MNPETSLYIIERLSINANLYHIISIISTHKLVVSPNFFIHKNCLSSFYLLIFYFEKFSTWTWRLPFAVYSLIFTFIMFGNCQNVREPRKRKFAAIRWTVANHNSVLRAGLEPRTSGAWYESQLPATRPSCRTKIDVWHPHCFWS